MGLIEEIKKEEGFSAFPHIDTLGFQDIGHGTKFPITEVEADWFLRHRLQLMVQELNLHKSLTLNKLPIDKLDILYNMCYQMGVPHLLDFKNMWAALEELDYWMASVEMLDSLWAKQTPQRAKRLAERMRK